MRYECEYFSRPYLGERRNGDLVVIKKYFQEDSQELEDVVCIVVDILGHGPAAADVADIAKTHLIKTEFRLPYKLMQDLNQALENTRGGAAGICRFDFNKNETTWAGIGNIHCKAFTSTSPFFCQDGIVGQFKREIRIQTKEFEVGDVYMFASDGVKSNFHFHEHPQWRYMSAKALSTAIVKSYGTTRDDATCAIMRVL
ncbi:MAG: hypothetical protein AAF518_17105 [Spirochaetota bacterium]